MPHTIDPFTGLKRRSLPIITFAVVFLITALCFIVVVVNQNRALLSNLDNFADNQTQSLRVFIDNDVAYIGSGANFFYSTDKENWDKFDTFAQHTINGSKSLIGLQWMEQVTEDQIPAHTEAIQARYPDYHVYTIPKDGPKTDGYIMDGEPIFIASDIYPNSDENIGLLGFYSSRERFKRVVDSIRDTREANLSDKVRLIQDGLDQSLEKTGMLVYHPVFKGHTNELLGVVVGVVRTTFYFENLIASTIGEIDVFVRVSDTGFDAEDDPILFETKGFEQVDGHSITKTIALTNRDWTVEFKLGEHLTQSSYLVLAGIAFVGFTIALLLSCIVNLQVREKERLSQMLDERTEELRFLVEHDSLTEIYNRRAFNKQLDDAVKQGRQFSLFSFDIDEFKTVNDYYGHPAGDALLIEISQVISKALRPNDRFFRLGGDEFSIISTVVETDELAVYLDTILSLVRETVVEYQGKLIGCTLSIGAAIYQCETNDSILQKADSMLYQSKVNGRDQVTIANTHPDS